VCTAEKDVPGPCPRLTQGECDGFMAKLENIITRAEAFLEALRVLDAKSLKEEEVLEIDDLRDRINSHFDFILGSSLYSEEEIKDWLENKDAK